MLGDSFVNGNDRRLNHALVGDFLFSLARRSILPSGILYCGTNTLLAARNSTILSSLGTLRRSNIRILAYNVYKRFCNIGSGLTINAFAGVCHVIRVLHATGAMSP